MKKPSKKRCPRCHVGGYKQSKAPADGRPLFTCTQCGYWWTNGKTGGEYVLVEKKEKQPCLSKS